MTVENIIKWDHAPIEMRVRWKGKAQEEKRQGREHEVRSVTRWDTKGITEYAKKLERYGKARNWT